MEIDRKTIGARRKFEFLNNARAFYLLPFDFPFEKFILLFVTLPFSCLFLIKLLVDSN